MPSPSRILLRKPTRSMYLRHLSNLNPTSSVRIGLALHHRSLTTFFKQSPRPTTYRGSILPPINRFSDSRSFSSSTNPPSSQPAPEPKPTTNSPPPTRLIKPSPLPDAAARAAWRREALAHAAAGDPEFIANSRYAAIGDCYAWVSVNFPRADGYEVHAFRTFGRDITYTYTDSSSETASAGDEQRTTTVTIPQSDTSLCVVYRIADPLVVPRVGGKKQGGLVCIALCALPPPGVGGPALAGTALVEGTRGTAAFEAAERAFLEYARGVEAQWGKDLEGFVEGCMAAVFMGGDMAVYEYEREKGFFEPPGGFEFVEEYVEKAALEGQFPRPAPFDDVDEYRN